MKTYKAVKSQIAKLERQAESLRRNELKTVIAQIRKTISDYGLTAADLGFGKQAAKPGRKPGKAKRRGSASAGVAKYRDPATQQTWTGRGRPPAWIVAAKNRDDYLIDAPKAAAPRRKAKRAATVKATRATAKKPTAPKKKARATKQRAKRMVKTPAVRIESGVASE